MTSKNDYEPVLLMEPILVGESKHKSHMPSPKDCTIGGTPHYYTLEDRSNPKCAICTHDMFLLAQIYAPLLEVGLERTLYVFGCNRGTCSDKVGSFVCLRDQYKCLPVTKDHETTNVDYDDDDDESGWGSSDDGSDNGDFSKLEAMLAANEKLTMLDKLNNTKKNDEGLVKSKRNDNSNSLMEVPQKFNHPGASTTSSFPRFLLNLYNEPKPLGNSAFDNDDSIGNIDSQSSDYIQSKLHKYLAEEEDSEVALAIKMSLDNKTMANEQSAGGDGEKDERLPASMATFFTFLSRVKLAPNQTVRYIYGGEPLWSTSPSRLREKQRGHKKVSACACGKERVFEFQLMPSILHFLKVDEWKLDGKNCSDDVEALFDLDESAMTWEVIAIFSCPDSCSISSEETIVIQTAHDVIVKGFAKAE